MMRRLLMLFVSFLASVFMFAEGIDKTQALRKAQEFMPGKNFQEVKSISKARGDALGDAFYVFNADNNGGFVIVSGDDRTVPILGYSRTGSIDMEKMPENMKWWLEGYARQIEALGTSVKPAQKVKVRGISSWPAIQPMIQTKWNQGTPYNLGCPDSKGRDWRDDGFATNNQGIYNTGNICVTGCVATAMAQILYYWSYPNTCPALNSYTTYSNGWSMKALPESSFDWDAMKLSYISNETTGESVSAIATLLRYCGQSVGMDYTLEASEASVSPSVLTNVFGYSKNIRQLYRDAYSTSQWEEIIYAELAAGRPVFYAGQADVGGHQFIVDGYDGNGLFHMNWGWGGMHDDEYFVLSLADPDGQGIGGSATDGAFQFDQDALIGVEPGNNEEALTPQIKSDIDAMTTHEYTRASTDDDFTGVQFRGAFYASYNMEPTEARDVQVGWALCQNGQVKNVVSSDSYTIAVGNTSSGFYTNKDNLTFGAGLALGKYEVCQVYKFTDNDAWSLCAPYWTVSQSYRTSFLVAEVTETTLTVRQVQPSFTVNNITASENPSTGNSLDVTLNVTNNGETFEQVIRLWAQKEGGTTWTPVATATRKIDPGESDDVVLSYRPTESGAFTLKVTNDKSDEALKTMNVIIYSSFETTINNLKFVCHTGTHKAKLVGNTYPSSPEVNVVIPPTFDVDGAQYTVSEIANYALMPSNYQYNPIASLTIPSTVESIGDYAVYNCYLLTELRIPEGVKHIGACAFQYCYWLKTIELPASLTSIGDEAFGNISNLNSVVSHISKPFAISDNVFGVVDGENLTAPTATLFVPAGTKPIYVATAGWNIFSPITEMDAKPGDANGIGGVDADDIKAVVRYIMEGYFEGFVFDNADVVKDGKVNAADLVKIIDMVENP